MQHRRNMVFLGILIGGALAGCQVSAGASTDPAATLDEIDQPSTIPCTTVCDCPLNTNTCSAGTCILIAFSPLPPNPVCGATCQCAAGTGCTGGADGQCVTATMTASQNPVIVPPGQTTATFTLSWNAPGFSTVDLWGQQNLQWPGQTIFLGSGPASGTAPEPMSVGEIATLWLYNHGDTTTPLAILHITGQH